MDQEILLEQIISYTIGASEMIPDIGKKADKEYQLALLPYGPHFYTGILQSAGYLLLPSKKKTLFVISQEEMPTKIVGVNGNIGPVLGQKRKIINDKSIWKQEIPLPETAGESIAQHMAFLTTIQTIPSKIQCIGIGEDLSPTQQQRLIIHLTRCLPTTNIIFLQNFTTHPGSKDISQKTFVAANTAQNTVKSFYTMSKKLKKTPEIIAYAHGDKK
jgi:hypothetical protein